MHRGAAAAAAAAAAAVMAGSQSASSAAASSAAASAAAAAAAGAPLSPPAPAERSCWRFTAEQLETTPSRLDGISYEDEQRLRLAGCAHILETIRLVIEFPARLSGPAARAPQRKTERLMRLPCSTACVLFNRFFTRQSFARHDRFLVATACAFLAFKVEEAHQKLYKVVSCARDAWYAQRAPGAPALTPAQEVALHQSILETERAVMYTLEFDVGVVHPYAYLGAHLKRWKLAGVFEPAWARAAKNCDAPREVEEALALASNLAFQALQGALPLRFSPQDLAAATLSLAFDVLYARRGGGGGGGGGSGSGSGGGGGGGAQQRYPPSPIRACHFALCSGVGSLEGICELRAAIPACLGAYCPGDSAVRLHLGLQGGVAPVAAVHTVEGGSGSGGGAAAAAAAAALPLAPLQRDAAAASLRLLSQHLAQGGEELEEAPQLAPAED